MIDLRVPQCHTQSDCTAAEAVDVIAGCDWQLYLVKAGRERCSAAAGLHTMSQVRQACPQKEAAVSIFLQDASDCMWVGSILAHQNCAV